jgi:hypothetical protein
VAMILKFESHMTTANVAALLMQRCTDGDLLAFRASSVQAGFENYSSWQSAGVLTIAVNRSMYPRAYRSDCDFLRLESSR